MLSARHVLSALLLVACPAAAQTAQSEHPAAPAVEADEKEAEHVAPLSFGLAGGALEYQGGRKEQALGAVVRWAATPWLSFAATPTMVRVREPSVVAGTLQTSSGMVDLPLDAMLTHGFRAPWSPGVALGLGVSLPLGDTASGFGAGSVGYSVSGGVGFSPAELVWVHVGAGRSLNGIAMQSAFASGNGWGDVSAGVSLTERISVNGGYSTDIGAVDSTTGHSTSMNGGFSYNVFGPATLNFNASRGLSGLAPRWSMALGFGTAFPYLNHLGAGSPLDQLRETFGGGTHGLGNGNGSTGGSSTGKGRGRKIL
ncbi:MAG: hypothetical protein ABIP93_00415 [Gemmatimonadaceae bacterium]